MTTCSKGCQAHVNGARGGDALVDVHTLGHGAREVGARNARPLHHRPARRRARRGPPPYAAEPRSTTFKKIRSVKICVG